MARLYVRFRLGSPLIMHEHSSLSGILCSIATTNAGGDWNAARAQVPLARDATDTMFIGSVAFRMPGPISQYSVTRSFVRTVVNYDLASDKRWLGGTKINNGPYKNLLNHYTVQATPEIWFAGDGDIEEVRRLLRQVDYVGSLRSKGFGRIDDLEVGPACSDRVRDSLFIEASDRIEPICPVPIHVAQTSGIDLRHMRQRSAKFDPPLWASTTTACVVPSRTVLDRDQIKEMVGADR